MADLPSALAKMSEPRPKSRGYTDTHHGPPGSELTHDGSLANERYVDQGEIGHGGMGAVRQVLDRSLLRRSAVKVLSPRLGFKESRVQRFRKEAQITGQLDHPNIVPIYELDNDDRGILYFSMKLVQGETLEQILRDEGEDRLRPECLAELLQIFLRVCDAVAFAHSRGVLHRDIKPSNIMVGDFGQVYLMDWGVAHLMKPEMAGSARPDETEAAEAAEIRQVEVDPELASIAEAYGSIVGTPRYMAPEQVQGQHDRLDARTDIFALGATLYHILTGHAPYTAKAYVQLLLQAQDVEITPPIEELGDRVPTELSRIAMRAMARSPEDRHATVGELKRSIERFLGGAWNLPTETFPAGSLIVREGDEADAAYVIVEGRCAAVDGSGANRVVLRQMGPGDVFGETAIFGKSRRTASVEALDDVKVMVVTREILTSGLGLGSWMGAFVKALAERFSEVDQELRTLKREPQDAGPDGGG